MTEIFSPEVARVEKSLIVESAVHCAPSDRCLLCCECAPFQNYIGAVIYVEWMEVRVGRVEMLFSVVVVC